jgi:tRNA pseudouridine38-40 synthase
MEDKKNIRLILAYDGSGYHGWQRQKRENTIQAVIEDCLYKMIREPVRLIGSGRTDAGVHALNQVCNFITKTRIGPESLRKGLNSLLPDDIYIRTAEYVPLDFHSRYSARSKTYEYRIWNQVERDIFLRDYSWHIRDDLNLEDIRKCMSLMTGKHDFSSFKSSGSGNKDPVREMILAEIHGPNKGILIFSFEAEGFLRHMVLNIMGTIVEVGKGKMGLDEFKRVFQSRDRRNAGMKAPARGLFLKEVKY